MNTTPSPNQDSSQQTLAVLGQDQNRSTLPPMMDAVEGATHRKRLPTGPLMMLAVVAAAGGLLFGMRQMGLGPKFTFANEKLNTEIPEQNKSAAANQELLMAELGALRTANQVPVDGLRKNPFMLAYAIGLKADAPLASDDPEAARRQNAKALAERILKAKAERAKAIKEKLAELQIQGVMGGSNPVCRINGRVYRAGDTVSDHFTVKTISGRSVELEADGELYIVEMPDPTSKK